jgi:hypothetical protein
MDILPVAIASVSDALPFQIGEEGYYPVLSFGEFGDNLLHYGLRTYGQLSLIVVGVVSSLLIERKRLSLKGLRAVDCLFSLSLFLVMLAPVILLRWRSGIYTYLPAVAAALLVGGVLQSLYGSASSSASTLTARRRRLCWAPGILAVAIFAGGSIGQSLRWIQMAEVNTSVLRQIAALHAAPDASTAIVLNYSEADRARRFPEGFSEWGFPHALRLLYGNPAINGVIVRDGEHAPPFATGLIRFRYTVKDGVARVTRE